MRPIVSIQSRSRGSNAFLALKYYDGAVMQRADSITTLINFFRCELTSIFGILSKYHHNRNVYVITYKQQFGAFIRHCRQEEKGELILYFCSLYFSTCLAYVSTCLSLIQKKLHSHHKCKIISRLEQGAVNSKLNKIL